MNAWDRYWHGEVAAVRPWLLFKGVLLLLAFDTWIVMAYHGGRYGVGEFNVAHFRWLDALQPLPTPGVYVGVVLLCGLIALAQVFTRPHRVALAALTALYTWSWAMSMLDSYQHHYLLSLLLLSMTFFPRLGAGDLFGPPDGTAAARPGPYRHPDEPAGETAAVSSGERRARPEEAERRGRARGGKAKKARRRAARRGKRKPQTGSATATASEPSEPRPEPDSPRHISAWAYASFLTTCAVVYGYTAVAKTEPDWRRGHALQRLTSGDSPFEPFEAFFTEQLGMSSTGFWELLGTSVILLQLVICAGYALSVRRETLPSKAARLYCGVALLGALSFHVGAELIDLRIGWFSYYMIFVALVAMLPERPLWVAARVLSWPSRRLAELWTHRVVRGDKREDPFSIGVLGVATAVVVGLLGSLVDLPGSLAAAIVAGVGLAAVAVHLARRGDASQAQLWVAAGGIAAVAMWLAIGASDVRYDYYRMVGGDARRRGELEKALVAYVKANRYAPRDPPLDARGVGDCDERLGYRWGGNGCEEVRGCRCEGADCGELRDEKSDCAESYAGHRDEKEQELRRKLGRDGP